MSIWKINKEKKPRKDGKYLVTFNDNGEHYVAIVNWSKEETVYFSDAPSKTFKAMWWTSINTFDPNDEKIVAWTYLPKPFLEAEEE